MKISLNWIKEYTDIDQPVDEIVQKIGRQLGAVEEVVELSAKYQGIVIAKVVSCQKHPNADRLSICLLDDGGVTSGVERNVDGLVQVVCGAPNVREGLLVAWLPPGSVVPSTFDSVPFKLDSRELRGVKSNGMIASGKELDINDSHQGILELDAEASSVGQSFAKVYGLDDYIIDIENKMFTHRPDCFGVLGVAREIAGIYGKKFESPEWYLRDPELTIEGDLSVSVVNELPELVPRFIASSISNVEVKPSPIRVQATLTKIGIKPINNIVDITNYMAHLTGQPLHAYDYDKVAALSSGEVSLTVRKPRQDEEIALLNGKTVKPHSDAIMIASDKEAIGIGGVIGGTSTEVDESTKNIILECANFDMYSIRRTSMSHGLFTDAVTRNSKGQSPLQNGVIAAQTISLINEWAGGELCTAVDFRNQEFIGKAEGEHSMVVEPEFINKRLGLNLSKQEVISSLRNVEFHISDSDGGLIFLDPPFWRTDVAIKEDIVEEVGRLIGFEKMPLDLPLRSSKPAGTNKDFQLKQKLRQKLASFGANEVLTYSFVHGNLLEKSGQNPELAFKLSNAISPDLQYYRISLTPSLLNNVHSNIKSGHDKFSLFEINKTHIKLHKDDDNGLPKEIGMVSFVTADKARKDPAFYQARAYLDALADSFGVVLEYKPIDSELNYEITAPFDYKRSALVSVKESDIFLGVIGEYKQSVARGFKLPVFCAGFELDMEGLLKLDTERKYTPLSRFPSTSQDICLEVDQDLNYANLTAKVNNSLTQNLPEDTTVTFVPIDIYKAENSLKKRITYRVTLTSYKRTLTDETLNKLLESLASSVDATRI